MTGFTLSALCSISILKLHYKLGAFSIGIFYVINLM